MLVAFSKSYFQVQEYLIIVHKKKKLLNNQFQNQVSLSKVIEFKP